MGSRARLVQKKPAMWVRAKANTSPQIFEIQNWTRKRVGAGKDKVWRRFEINLKSRIRPFICKLKIIEVNLSQTATLSNKIDNVVTYVQLLWAPVG